MPVKRSGWDLDRASALSFEEVVMTFVLVLSKLVVVPTNALWVGVLERGV